MSRTALGTICGLTAAGIWGGMYVVSKVVLDVIPPFALITCRLALGSLTLWIIVLWRGSFGTPGPAFWKVFGVGTIGYGLSLGLQFVGTKLSTAANGALVTSATPAFILIFAARLLRERLSATRLVAVLVSTVGVLAVIDPGKIKLDPSLFLGNLALLGAAITWALYSVLIRRVTQDTDVLTVSLIAFLGGFPIALPSASAEIMFHGIGHVSAGIVLGVLFLGIVCTALAMLLWNTAFALLEAGQASLTFFAQPVVGTALGWFFLKESITPLFLVGGALIALGLFITSRESQIAAGASA